MVWFPHLFKNFPQFVVIHTVKGFGVVNKAEVDVFLKLCCFFDNPVDVGNMISGSSAFSGASQVAQRVKHLPAMWETWARSLGWEDPLEKGILPTPVFLPGKSHGWRRQSMGSQRVRHN